MKPGQVIRQANGADCSLWRIEETYEADSPYVFAVLVSTHKLHKAGTKKRLIYKADYKVEPDPEGYAKTNRFTLVMDVDASKAMWG